jgi:uncharacterized membrane protein
MSWFRPRDLLDQTFEVGIILKGLDGVLEVIGGLLLLVVSPATIDRLVTSLTQHELSEDPHDLLATHLLKTAHGLTGAAVLFGAVYLLAHGLVKVVLVAALLKNQLWAYPWTIAFSGGLHRLPALPADPETLGRPDGLDDLRRPDRLVDLARVPQAARARRR